MVSPHCGLFNVSASVENLQRFLYTRRMQIVSLQYELVKVTANQIDGKTTLYTEGRHGVSHQYELIRKFKIPLISKRFCAQGAINQLLCNLCFQTLFKLLELAEDFVFSKVSTASSRLSKVQKIPICFSCFYCINNQGQLHLEHLLHQQKADVVTLLLPPFQSLHHIQE